MRLLIQLNDNLAALAELRLNEEHLALPDWLRSPDRVLVQRWSFGDGPYTTVPPEKSIAVEFVQRRVLVDKDTLAGL